MFIYSIICLHTYQYVYRNLHVYNTNTKQTQQCTVCSTESASDWFWPMYYLQPHSHSNTFQIEKITEMRASDGMVTVFFSPTCWICKLPESKLSPIISLACFYIFRYDWSKHIYKRKHDISGQIIIFHQPRFPWNKGISPTKLPFGVRSCEVAIIWPDISTIIWKHPENWKHHQKNLTTLNAKLPTFNPLTALSKPRTTWWEDHQLKDGSGGKFHWRFHSLTT